LTPCLLFTNHLTATNKTIIHIKFNLAFGKYQYEVSFNTFIDLIVASKFHILQCVFLSFTITNLITKCGYQVCNGNSEESLLSNQYENGKTLEEKSCVKLIEICQK